MSALDSQDVTKKEEIYTKKFERIQDDILALKEAVIKFETSNEHIVPAAYNRGNTNDISKSFAESKNVIQHKKVLKRIQSIMNDSKNGMFNTILIM